LTLLGALASQAVAQSYLRLNGATVEQELSYGYFDSDGNFVVEFSDGSTAVYNPNRIDIVQGSIEVGISEMRATQFFSIKGQQGDELQVEGLAGDELLRVYAADGRLACQQQAQASTVTLNLKGCAAGNYLLVVGQQVIKFVKK